MRKAAIGSETMYAAENMVDLAGRWSVASLDGRYASPMALPGDVHTALIEAKIIANPYAGRNEYDVRWVAEETWQARRIFEFNGAMDRGWYLDITYLDTVADVFVNDSLVLSASNCFRRYRPDVSHAICNRCMRGNQRLSCYCR